MNNNIFFIVTLLFVGCQLSSTYVIADPNSASSGLSSSSAIAASSSVSPSIASPAVSASNAYPSLQSLLAANPPSEQVVTLPASAPLSAASSPYASQLANLSPEQQELVVQHPNPRRILVRVVKPIIFEERIVIVPYRRVTHEVRPVIEERHTVIYGKDGKQISGQPGFSKELPGLDKPGSYASASGHLTRTIEKPVYTEPIIRKMGFSKRSSIDFTNLRPSSSPISSVVSPLTLDTNRYANQRA